MTLRRTSVITVGTAAFAMTLGACAGNGPDGPGTTPTIIGTPTTATPSPSPSATKPASTPTAMSTNAPLTCPDAMEVAAATESTLTVVTTDSPTQCAYASSTGKRTASIQSEDWFRVKSLKAYRAAVRKGNETITATIKDRPDFGKGAFMLTLTAKSSASGAISSLIVPRADGQFASISASRIKDGVLTTDVDLTEQLAHAFLDN